MLGYCKASPQINCFYFNPSQGRSSQHDAGSRRSQGEITYGARRILRYAERFWVERQPAELSGSTYRPPPSAARRNPYHLFTNSWKSCVKTPFGSLGGGCREKEKGFLHHCVLMGQKAERHLQSLMSCRKALLYSYPPPPPSCPSQPGSCSLPFLPLAARGWAGSKLLPQHHVQPGGPQAESPPKLGD